MVFQRPNPFPTMSIYENVAAGLRSTACGGRPRRDRSSSCLRQAALWDEVKDRLTHARPALSGGQQQRLCIARALAVEPEVLLMDEPASALDPIATAKIEELIHELKERYTIVIVTHNMQQAARVSDYTAFFYLGELVESRPDRADLHQPARASAPRTTSPASSGESDRRMAPRTPTRPSSRTSADLREKLLAMGGQGRGADRQEHARPHRPGLGAGRAGHGRRTTRSTGSRSRSTSCAGRSWRSGSRPRATCASSPPR